MNDNELKSTLENIKAKDSLKQKIIHNSYEKTNYRKFNLKKPIMVLTACLLIISFVFAIPLLTRNSNKDLIKTDFLGLLTVKACAADSTGNNNISKSIDLKQDVKILLGAYSPLMSSVPGYPFEFVYPGAKIEITVTNGVICIWGQETKSKVTGEGKSYTIEESGRIYWSPLEGDSFDYTECNLEFRIIENEHIIGVGWIIIKEDNDTKMFSAQLSGVTGFPKQDGKYQDIDNSKINSIKNNKIY